MSTSADKGIECEWTCEVPADVVSVATSMGSHRTMVGTLQGAVLIDGGGSIVGEVAIDGQVDVVRASDDGRCFGILTKEGKLHGFSPKGRSLWQVDVEGASDFDLGCTAEEVALAVPPYSVLVAETNDPDSCIDLTFQHKVATLALLEGELPGVVAAGELGEVSKVDLDGELAWEDTSGFENGPMRLSHAAERVAVAVQDEGVQTYSYDGEDTGKFRVGSDATVVVPALGPSGPLYAVLTDENSLLVLEEGGQQLCECEFTTLIIDYDFSDDASILAAGGDDQKLYGFRMPAGNVTWMLEARTSEQASEEEPQPREKKESSTSESSRIQEEKGVPRPKGAEAVGEISINDDTAPKKLEQIWMSPDGVWAASVVPEGIMVIDEEGKVAQELEVDPSTRIAQKRNNKKAFFWNEDKFGVIDLSEGTSKQFEFQQRARLVDCTADGKMVALVTVDNELRVFRPDGEETCRRRVQPVPTQIYISPGGSTILTRDEEGRFRFFNKEGEQQRKQRISGDSTYDQVILEEGFCALGSTGGRVIVHEMSGKVLWTKRVTESVDRMGSLENSIAVYSDDGICMVLNPYGEVEMEFEPPPGLSKLRWPENEDPLLMHARRDVLTLYGGYSRKLNAQWTFRCDAPIRVFDVDRNARHALIAAGDTLYRVERPG